MNKVIISGTIASDINLKKTQTGKSVVSYSMKLEEEYNGKVSTTYIDCTAWGTSAEKLNTYFQKGQWIECFGKLSKSSYTNQQGQKVYKTEVVVSEVVLPNAGSNVTQNTYQNTQQKPTYNNQFGGSFGEVSAEEEEHFENLPF